VTRAARCGRPAARAAWRRFWLGLLTVSGLARRGFFIPHRYAATLPPAGARPSYPAVEARLRAAEPAFREAIGWVEDCGAALAAIGDGAPPAPRWAQAWFAPLDAAVAYALVRRRHPARIVEVGSGHSTRFLARAVADGALSSRILAIDPAPRAALSGLPVTVRRTTVQAAGPAPFRELQAGDILFIDSSHILMPGSDVDFLLGQILPALPAGVLLHLHDIFLPDDYPADWDWRGYNEQLGVLPMLLDPRWRPVFASHYAATRMAESVGRSVVGRLPRAAGARDSSLWLERGEAA